MQEKQRDDIANKLEYLEGKIKDLVAKNCSKSLDEFRREHRISNSKEGEQGNEKEDYDAFLVGDSSRKSMYYAQEATIRSHYRKLTKFIRLCDY